MIKKRIPIELLLSPTLILIPIIVGLFFINNWYIYGYLEKNADYIFELLLGSIIIIGNLAFDIPFLNKIRKKTI